MPKLNFNTYCGTLGATQPLEIGAGEGVSNYRCLSSDTTVTPLPTSLNFAVGSLAGTLWKGDSGGKGWTSVVWAPHRTCSEKLQKTSPALKAPPLMQRPLESKSWRDPGVMPRLQPPTPLTWPIWAPPTLESLCLLWLRLGSHLCSLRPKAPPELCSAVPFWHWSGSPSTSGWFRGALRHRPSPDVCVPWLPVASFALGSLFSLCASW